VGLQVFGTLKKAITFELNDKKESESFGNECVSRKPR
jgi:hypothetical protein